jgi:zinc transport system permease protein
MNEFFSALPNDPFLRHAVIAGVLASIACGVMGPYVVVKRIVFIAGGIAHTVLGGMGFAIYMGWGSTMVMLSAVAAAILSAIVIGIASLRAGERADTVIGALWAIGMALGIIFIGKAPGYREDLMTHLFGTIILVRTLDIVIIAALDVGILLLVALFYKQFLAVCFDEEYAQLQGVRRRAIYLLLLVLVALTVVILIKVVGLILVIALLTLPAAIAGNYARSLAQMMTISALLGIVFTMTGLAASYAPELPAGPTIILVAAVAYLLNAGARSLWRRRRQARQATDAESDEGGPGVA